MRQSSDLAARERVAGGKTRASTNRCLWGGRGSGIWAVGCKTGMQLSHQVAQAIHLVRQASPKAVHPAPIISLVALQVQHRRVQTRAGPLVRLQPAVSHGLCMGPWAGPLGMLSRRQAAPMQHDHAGCMLALARPCPNPGRSPACTHRCACMRCLLFSLHGRPPCCLHGYLPEPHLHVVLGPRLVHQVEHHCHLLRQHGSRHGQAWCKHMPLCPLHVTPLRLKVRCTPLVSATQCFSQLPRRDWCVACLHTAVPRSAPAPAAAAHRRRCCE